MHEIIYMSLRKLTSKPVSLFCHHLPVHIKVLVLQTFVGLQVCFATALALQLIIITLVCRSWHLRCFVK